MCFHKHHYDIKLMLFFLAKNDELITRIMELENQLRQERESNLEAIRTRESEIQEMRGSIEVHIRNYEELMNVKLNLDREIATYRVLLEGGEAR